MNYLLGIVAAIGVLLFFGITIFVHELGHFLAARALKFRVDAFSIGFGPSLWKRKVGHTVYKIGCIPFGGYVALPQLDPSGMDAIQGKNGETVAEAIRPATWWKRILVSLAGPFGNVVLAVIVAFIVAALPPPPNLSTNDGAIIGFVKEGSEAGKAGLLIGDKILFVGETPIGTWQSFVEECHFRSGVENPKVALVVSNTIVEGAARMLTVPLEEEGRMKISRVAGIAEKSLCAIGAFTTNSPAEKANLRVGDILLDVDGQRVFGCEHFLTLIRQDGQAVTLTIRRDSTESRIEVTPLFNEEAQRWMIGVAPYNAEMSVSQWLEYRQPWDQVKGDSQAILKILRKLVAPKHKGETAKVAGALGGPIMILTSLWFGIMVSPLSTLAFIRFLNVNLAILNLLPIPVLDGGHILIALYEGTTRRKVNPKLLGWIMNFFMVLLLALFAILTFRDIRGIDRYFSKNTPKDAPKVETKK